jgi:predicted nucleotidyltransferase component of viral defense system
MDFTEIRRRTIVALFSDDALFDELVLKGGNAISLIYGFGNRASLDLDFSIENDFKDPKDTARRIFAALDRHFNEAGFTVFDTKFGPRPERERLAAGPRWGGYQFEFKLIETSKTTALGGNLEAIRRNALVVGPGQLRRFTVDLSKYEYCVGKVERELDHYTIYVYTPEMIVIEKLRAICQQMPAYQLNPNKRARARDFYDVHLLVRAEGIDLTNNENLAVLQDIFRAKDVPVDLLKDIAGQYELHRLDWAAVKDSVSAPLQEFDFYFDFVLGEVARILKALGVV